MIFFGQKPWRILSFLTVPKRKSNYFNIDENIVSSEKISIELIDNDEFENIELFAHAEDTNLKVKKLKSSFEVFLDNDIGSLKGPIYFSISNGEVYEEISFDLNLKPKQTQIIYFIILAVLGGLRVKNGYFQQLGHSSLILLHS